ncbi:YhcN/YlaJ family sporulation lipoprotein [Peribacillus alkalitolerans]|uniref:YhcN/YlaJ family sporulation lipoprotein n=1 Tax=Peribacillus alkalitolerans TaxID=1550385 RepID=UPI0013D6BB3F|nr:YhcN/YlaJ family sporulation lipoprotein [Peribacillus alkalitolerans]
MRTKLGKALIIIVVLALFSLTGCSATDKSKDTRLALMKTTNPHPAVLKETKKEFDFAEGMQKYVLSFPEIYDAAIVTGEKKILVAYKVKHLQRFRMKKIEKDLTKKLEKKYPNHKFVVSSDYKIFMEVVELNDHLKDPNYSRKKANKKFKDILELKKEQI